MSLVTLEKQELNSKALTNGLNLKTYWNLSNIIVKGVGAIIQYSRHDVIDMPGETGSQREIVVATISAAALKHWPKNPRRTVYLNYRLEFTIEGKKGRKSRQELKEGQWKHPAYSFVFPLKFCCYFSYSTSNNGLALPTSFGSQEIALIDIP